MNRALLEALECNRVGSPPVWIMRQAGRYMPEYQELRKKYSLLQLFHEPELAAQVTLLPIDLLGVDAAIIFSDILVLAEALGLSVLFPDQGGPRIEPPITMRSQIENLPLLPVEESLFYVFQTIALVKKQIQVPLIGFCGGPFTLASYFIDSTSREAFSKTKRWMREDPESFHRLLQKITDVTILYLKKQIEAGVDALQIFDSWLNQLDKTQRHLFAYPYLQQILDALKSSSVPTILFCRHSSLFPEELATLNPSCISFDWLHPMQHLRSCVSPLIAVQGNLDPAILKLPPSEITSHVQDLLRSMQGEKGYIVNLGHGITPDIPFDHVRHFVDLIKNSPFG
ncbi:MAG: uroporphyrinogen decarboxylase [Chlamydiales bacterium]|nr:uroporphyrinogen decarboxylase [Chlamydiales bacterium]